MTDKDSYQWCPESRMLWTVCNCPRCIDRKQKSQVSSEVINNDEISIEDIDKERLWNDVKKIVREKITEGKTEISTRSQGKKFWLIKVTSSYIRVEREKSEMPHEDIPKSDFIDIWIDLHNRRYISSGYTQKDLHNGQNRHTAVTFSILSYISYIEERKGGRALKYYLKKDKLK